MKIIKNTLFATIAFLCISCNNDDYGGDPEIPVQTKFNVLGVGPSVAIPKTIVHPGNGETFEVFCFIMDMVDADTGEVLGTLEDCEFSTEFFDDGSILSGVLTTYNFTGRGSITSENQVLQTPLTDGLFRTSFTPTENNIVDSSFEFEGAKGKVSVSGEVDLSKFDQDIIIFNCGFAIELESY